MTRCLPLLTIKMFESPGIFLQMLGSFGRWSDGRKEEPACHQVRKHLAWTFVAGSIVLSVTPHSVQVPHRTQYLHWQSVGGCIPSACFEEVMAATLLSAERECLEGKARLRISHLGFLILDWTQLTCARIRNCFNAIGILLERLGLWVWLHLNRFSCSYGWQFCWFLWGHDSQLGGCCDPHFFLFFLWLSNSILQIACGHGYYCAGFSGVTYHFLMIFHGVISCIIQIFLWSWRTLRRYFAVRIQFMWISSTSQVVHFLPIIWSIWSFPTKW